MDKETQREIQAILKKLDKLPEAIGVTPKGRVVKKNNRVRSALRASAKKFIPKIQTNIQDSTRKHYRYVGDGTKITYYPGNLRKSQNVMTFRKASPLAVFVGPKRSRGKNTSFGNGKKFDPYYAPFIHNGTDKIRAKPFIEKGYNAGKQEVVKDLKKRVENIFRYYAKQKGLGRI